MNVIRLVAAAVLAVAGLKWAHARWPVDTKPTQHEMQIEQCTIEIYVPSSCGLLPLPWGP